MKNDNNIVDNFNSKNLDNHKASEDKNNNLEKNHEILNINDSLNTLPNNNSSINLNQDSPSEQSLNKKLDATHFGDWQINCKTIDF